MASKSNKTKTPGRTKRSVDGSARRKKTSKPKPADGKPPLARKGPRSAAEAQDRLNRLPPVLIDTNVASYLFGKKREAELYAPCCDGRRALLAVQTVAELRIGATSPRIEAGAR